MLSTCNRTEIYARCTHFHPAVGDVRDFLAAHSGADPDEFADQLYTYYDDAAVAHLFSVAAGLDSMIVGESEILGQVREAWQTAVREGTHRPLLSRTFRHAVESGKRVRTETGIGRHPVSIPSAAVAVAAEHLGALDGARVLVVGAGQMGAGLASTLRARGVARDRRREPHVRARRRARGPRRRRADPARRDRRHARRRRRAARVDRVAQDARRARDGRDGDGVPRRAAAARRRRRRARDVDPGCRARSPTSRCSTSTTCKDFGGSARPSAAGEIGKVREILAAEIERYRAERSARRGRRRSSRRCATAARSVRARELERFRAKLDELDPDARDLVDALTQGIVNKLLHEPTVRVKDAARNAAGRATTPTRSPRCSTCPSRRRRPTIRVMPHRDRARQRARAVAGRARRRAARR